MIRLLAFLRRDFLIATSYRFQFLFGLAGAYFVVATFFFVAKLVRQGDHASLGVYGGDYFAFALIGLAGSTFLQTGLSGFTQTLRTAMVEGTLEMMFATKTRPQLIVALPSLWSFSYEGLRALVILGFGAVAFGVDLRQANVGSALLVVLLTIAAYSSFGLLSAAIILIIKRGDPINWALAHATALLGGAYFPVDLLPSGLQTVAQALPMTHSYHALRLTLLRGAGLAEISAALIVLTGYAVIGLPLAWWACGRAIEYARQDGSLGTF